MSVKDLRDLLERLEDTREIVLHADEGDHRAWPADELFEMWRDARAEAHAAYAEWCDRRGAEVHTVYRAAEDRADAAWAALAALSDRQSELLPS
jgi:hypothetical protein